ncbi:hypothetical protein CL614_00350 [archaeon]|nr:hypothetical protein [archaeon]|tara:strand:- start:1011 stop:1421 length:411 start_codon:yes stop_codon:yes gene_type:complete
MKKTCPKCKKDLDISNFALNKAKRDGFQAYCRECKKEYDHKHYLANKQYFYDRAKKRQKELVEWYEEYKKSLVCEKCGEDRWYVLVFHHNKELGKKEIEVSIAIKNGRSIEKIKKEIEKCNVLCSNCHIELHFLEK